MKSVILLICIAYVRSRPTSKPTPKHTARAKAIDTGFPIKILPSSKFTESTLLHSKPEDSASDSQTQVPVKGPPTDLSPPTNSTSAPQKPQVEETIESDDCRQQKQTDGLNKFRPKKFHCVKQKDGHRCNMTVLEQFIPNKDTVDYNSRDTSRSKFCPNRYNFCCSVPEMLSMYGQYKRGKRSIESIYDYHTFFYENFRMNSPNRIKKLIISWKNPTAKAKMPAEVFNKIEKDIDYIADRIERINLSFVVIKDFILRFYSGLMCNICGPRSSSSFVFNKVDNAESSNGLTVIFSSIFFRELVNVNTYYMYYLKFLSKLTNLIELYLYYIGDTIPKRVLQYDDYYQKQLNIFVECRKMMAKNDNKEVDQAIKKCKSAFKLIPDLRTAKGLEEIIITLQSAHDYLSNVFPLQFFEVADQKRMVIPEFYHIDNQDRLAKIVSFMEYTPFVQRHQFVGVETEKPINEIGLKQKELVREVYLDPTNFGMDDKFTFNGAKIVGILIAALVNLLF